MGVRVRVRRLVTSYKFCVLLTARHVRSRIFHAATNETIASADTLNEEDRAKLKAKRGFRGRYAGRRTMPSYLTNTAAVEVIAESLVARAKEKDIDTVHLAHEVGSCGLGSVFVQTMRKGGLTVHYKGYIGPSENMSVDPKIFFPGVEKDVTQPEQTLSTSW